MVLETILQVIVDNTTTTVPPIVATVAPSTLELFNALITNVYLIIGAVAALLAGPLGAFIFKSFKNGKEIQATALTAAAMMDKLATDNAQTKSILKIFLSLTPEEGKKYLERADVRAILAGTSETIGNIKDEINTISQGMPQGARAMMQKAATTIDATNTKQ